MADSIWESPHVFLGNQQPGSLDTVTSSLAQVIVVSPLSQIGEKIGKMKALRDDPVYGTAQAVIENAQKIIQIALTNPSQLAAKTGLNLDDTNDRDIDISNDTDAMDTSTSYTP